jgi:ribonuclease P protein component
MQRAYRLRGSAVFQQVRARKRSWANSLLVLNTASNELGHPRLGVVVSRRVGKAVVRNRVRRRIREAVRLRLMDLTPSCDLVFLARVPSAAADWSALRGAVDELLRRARLTTSGSRAAANDS